MTESEEMRTELRASQRELRDWQRSWLHRRLMLSLKGLPRLKRIRAMALHFGLPPRIGEVSLEAFVRRTMSRVLQEVPKETKTP